MSRLDDSEVPDYAGALRLDGRGIVVISAARPARGGGRGAATPPRIQLTIYQFWKPFQTCDRMNATRQ